MTRLQNGQAFPAFDVPAVGGGTISIPQSLQGSYGVVLIYRGEWCPYCQAQLAGFQRASEKLAEAGIKILALSVDNEATTVGTIEKFKLSFPVGHSADADKVASITGAYTNESPRYLQATGFLLAPLKTDSLIRTFSVLRYFVAATTGVGRLSRLADLTQRECSPQNSTS